MVRKPRLHTASILLVSFGSILLLIGWLVLRKSGVNPELKDLTSEIILAFIFPIILLLLHVSVLRLEIKEAEDSLSKNHCEIKVMISKIQDSMDTNLYKGLRELQTASINELQEKKKVITMLQQLLQIKNGASK